MRHKVTHDEFQAIKIRLKDLNDECDRMEMQRRRVWADKILENGLPLYGTIATRQLSRVIANARDKIRRIESRIRDIERHPELLVSEIDDLPGQGMMEFLLEQNNIENA